MKTSNVIIPGSLGALAKQNNKSIAETFLGADVVVIVDTSGSMHDRDARNGQSRYAVACSELEQLQNTLPGKIAVLSFSNDVVFCPDGKPVDLGGSTRLHVALSFAKCADVPGIRFIVISDGYPDAPEQCLLTAAQYVNRIDTIFVGPEDDTDGREFLRRLASAGKGQTQLAANANTLMANVQQILFLHD
jgi:predicted metal-dependent peptidase